MYTCFWCGKPTPNYREYLHPMAGILGESGYSACDECLRGARIEREWENEQCAEERLICPYCESSIDDPWYYDEDDEEVDGVADRGDGAEGSRAGARPGPRAQEVEEGEAMRLIEKLRRMIIENRRVRKSIEARRARRLRRSMR